MLKCANKRDLQSLEEEHNLEFPPDSKLIQLKNNLEKLNVYIVEVTLIIDERNAQIEKK